ncbi:MAG TPA: CPBP family intramembrane glutamic endopeptidase [Candidatus Acidoferrales bacterium]|nr:CPBP family intramembrane glutamic endopeptidase [Candidatus Acidoferrales bacterium]
MSATFDLSEYRRRLALLDVVAIPLLTLWAIWRMVPDSRAWLVLPGWVAMSFFVHRDTPKTLGWRADNFFRAAIRASLLLGPMAVALFAAGCARGSSTAALTRGLSFRHLWNYFAFCLLQQVALNSLITNRLLYVTRDSRLISAAISAGIFALLHWPNPVLVPMTLVGGFAMCWLFARERNILPLALWQAVLGSLIAWSFPAAWHHNLRVGPGYFTWR